ncbi:unnamed protein product, partial [Mesorhabditis spiculigera]
MNRRQLAERTDILECAWHKRQEEGGEEEDEDHQKPIVDQAQLDAEADAEDARMRARRVKTFSTSDGWATRERAPNEFEHISRWRALTVYLTWVVLIMFAYVREFLRNWGIETSHIKVELDKQKQFTPLFDDFAAVYQRNCYVNLLDRYTDDGGWTFK